MYAASRCDPTDYYEMDQVRLACSFSLCIYFFAFIVVIIYRPNNELNKITLLPYYNILVFQLVLTVYFFVVVIKERSDGCREEWWYIVCNEFLCLLLWNTCLW